MSEEKYQEKDESYFPEYDNEDVSELEIESESELEADQELVGHEKEHVHNMEYDKKRPSNGSRIHVL